MISVIIPVYQAEEYLDKCINSVINQEYVDLEILLIDDGSRDSSPNICDEYAKKDNRIKVYHKNNTGVSDTRNFGLNKASGDYITFLDSDDYIEPCMYSRMMDIALKYECDVVMCDCIKENGEKSIPYSHNIRSGFYNKAELEDEYYDHILIMENIEYPATISNWLLLFKRKLSTHKPLPRYVSGVRYSEDLLFGAELMMAAGSFYYLKGEYYHHYVMNPNSATHKFVPDKWNDYLVLYERAKKLFDINKERYLLQTNKLLLFFVYNAVGDILHANDYNKMQKMIEAKKILNSKQVREMFKQIKIWKLPIGFKLKIMTYLYKYKIGLKILM